MIVDIVMRGGPLDGQPYSVIAPAAPAALHFIKHATAGWVAVEAEMAALHDTQRYDREDDSLKETARGVSYTYRWQRLYTMRTVPVGPIG